MQVCTGLHARAGFLTYNRKMCSGSAPLAVISCNERAHIFSLVYRPHGSDVQRQPSSDATKSYSPGRISRSRPLHPQLSTVSPFPHTPEGVIRACSDATVAGREVTSRRLLRDPCSSCSARSSTVKQCMRTRS